jgi:hypothetical protein
MLISSAVADGFLTAIFSKVSRETGTFVVLLTALCLFAQIASPQATEMKGTPARAAPSDYQAQAHAGSITIAADFAGHTVPTLENNYATEDYIVVEVAFFGEPQARLKLSIEDFSLHINDKKAPLMSQPFVLVEKNLKDPEWEPPEKEKEKSKTSINGGGSNGDSTPALPPKMPIELRHAMDIKVQKAVLPEGDRALPVAGLIFFPYRNKTQSIHNMELIYSGPAGKASFALQP